MPGIREKQLEKRKLETLEVALRMLTEKGYANLNMDELAVEAGISKPTLYQYFNSKEDLAAQAVGRRFEKMEEQVAALPWDSPLNQLERYLRSLLDSPDQRGQMTPADFELMRAIVKQHPHMWQHMQHAREKLELIVKRGQSEGEIDPSYPAWVIVGVIFSLQRIVHNPFNKGEPERSEAERAEAVEGIVRLFRRGVSAEVALKA